MMISSKAFPCAVLLASLVSTGGAQSALIGRLADADGRYQAVYDTGLNITWLADANLAGTSGYDGDGLLDWTGALEWVAGLNAAQHLGVGDWRLPVSDGCGGYLCNGSELGHLFYAEFDGRPGYGAPMPALSDPDLALFSNLPNGRFWSDNAYTADTAWAFEFGPYDVGRQTYFLHDQALYAWAVRDGDIAAPAIRMSALAVPGPGTLGLLGAGVLGIVGAAHRRAPRHAAP